MQVNLADKYRSTKNPPRQHLRRNIVQTRLLLALAILAFAGLNPNVANKREILIGTAAYAVFHVVFGFVRGSLLRLKRVRFVRALADVAIISLVTFYTGDRDSSWFIFYALPIMSVSRYLGIRGSLTLAAIAAGAYSVVFVHGTHVTSPEATNLALRISLFFAVAVAARDLARLRKADDLQFLEVFNGIYQAMRNSLSEHAYRRILNRAMELTNSEMGSMSFTGDSKPLTSSGFPSSSNSTLKKIDKQLVERATRSKHSWRLPLTPARLKLVLGEEFILSPGSPRSVLVTPILIDDRVEAVIAVYSRYRRHYTRMETEKLERFISAMGIVFDYARILKSFEGNLGLVLEISTQLNRSHNLEDLFKNVVQSVVTHCKSEEAALFVAEPSATKATLKKVAVKSRPGNTASKADDLLRQRKLEEQLRSHETAYLDGEGVVGMVFNTGRPRREKLEPGEQPIDDPYGELLPSGVIESEIAAPLLFGDERLGVIRAINHFDPAQPLENSPQGVATRGFDQKDLTLLRIIASQVAAAIHNSRQRAQYENLVNNSPDPIIVLDAHSRIKEFNKACEEVWNLTYEEVFGRRVEEYYQTAEHAKKIGDDLKASKNQRLRNYEAFIKDRDDNIIPISLSAALLQSESGVFEGSIGVFKDLRPMRLLEDKVRATETLAALGRLARIVGHEIKNQMQIVLTYVKPKLLEQCRKDNQPQLYKMYNEIRGAALSSIETLNSTLLAANLRPPKPRITTTEDFFRKVQERMSQGAEAENVAFDVTLRDQEYELSADVEQMQLVLWNLYHNSMAAIQARRELDPDFGGGRIEVSTEVVADHIHLIWRDDGIGIRNEDLPNIFEAFFTKNKPLGSGLGLYLSLNVVEGHGGELTASSQPGSGACFKIALPIRETPTLLGEQSDG